MPGQRDSFFHPHPMYDMPGFGVDALPMSYTTKRNVVAATAVDITSAAVKHNTNGFEVSGDFAGGCQTCQLDILDADNGDAVLKTFNLKPGYVPAFTFYSANVTVSQHPNLKFKVSKITGGGTVAINITPTAK